MNKLNIKNKNKINIITYTLKQPDGDYKRFFNQIKKSDKWCHFIESTWIIISEQDSDYWSDILMPLIYETDTLMVIEVKIQDINGYLSEKAWKWLQKNIIP